MVDWDNLRLTIGAELWLVLAALIGVVLGAILKDKFEGVAFRFGVLALLAAAGLVGFLYEGGEALGGLLASSPFTSFAKIVTFVMAALALLMAEPFLRRHGTLRFEYPILVLFSCAGLGITLSADDLMTLYMGIETVSLSSYVLASFHRDNARSSEAGLKYFVLGALASGILLYGASLVYGFTGSTRFEVIALADPSIGLLFGMVLMIVGLAFKVSAAPMHIWTPDVYEGAPTPVGAFFAAAPKIALMAVFAKVLFDLFGARFADWQLILAIVAGLSMIIGTLGALPQQNLKRLLGYSSIANIGYALIAVSAGAVLGAGPMLAFMTLYVIASIGLFAAVLTMRRDGGMVENISELGGLVRSRPWLAGSITVLCFSIAGIPPFVGFFGKVFIVEAGLEAGLLPLVIILIISSVLSLVYYLRIVYTMWAGEPQDAFERTDASVMFVVLGTAIACVGLIIFLQQLADAADAAALGVIA